MAINDGFYWYKNVLKKQLNFSLRIYLSLVIVLYPIFFMNSANASSVGGWSMGNPVAQGASTIYEGSKNVIINGADYVKKGTAKITPSAANVAKTLGKGVAGVAVSVAVEQLLGAVDWVLDPANNQISYNPPSNPTDFYLYNSPGSGSGGPFIYSATAAANRACSIVESIKRDDYYLTNCVPTGINSSNPSKLVFNYTYTTVYPDGRRVNNSGSYTSTGQKQSAIPEQEKKTIPLSSVASQVITNAESETDTEKKAAAQAVTVAAAADIVAEAETDSVKARPIAQQLEATSTTKPADQAVADKAAEAQGTAKPNEANPQATDLALEFPAFCGWAPVVCEAAQVAISFPQTLADWWEAAKDWATTEPQQNEPENLDIEDLELEASDVNLTASGTCPQDSVSFSVMGKSVTLDMPYQPLCDALDFFKPAVLLVGAVASVYIVAGVRTKEEDQA